MYEPSSGYSVADLGQSDTIVDVPTESFWSSQKGHVYHGNQPIP